MTDWGAPEAAPPAGANPRSTWPLPPYGAAPYGAAPVGPPAYGPPTYGAAPYGTFVPGYPRVSRSGLPGWAIALIAGGAAVLMVGFLAAIAIPVFLDQRATLVTPDSSVVSAGPRTRR